jgi:hypothetical protein
MIQSCVVDIQKYNHPKKIKEKRDLFEQTVKSYYPDFEKHFKYRDVEFSIKTKIRSATDFRGSLLEVDGKFISVFSGKIDTIHVSEKSILEVIK